MAMCTGSPTFQPSSNNPNRFTEWPAKIPGFVCKTPPFGRGNAPRFAQCCSGTVFKITSPTNEQDQAYPMSCALFCQVDPKLVQPGADGVSPHQACLTNGGSDSSDWEVVCASNPAAGTISVPTSYPSTFSGGIVTSTAEPTASSESSSVSVTKGAGTTSSASSSTTQTGTPAAPGTATTAPSAGSKLGFEIGWKATVKAWTLGAMILVALC